MAMNAIAVISAAIYLVYFCGVRADSWNRDRFQKSKHMCQTFFALRWCRQVVWFGVAQPNTDGRRPIAQHKQLDPFVHKCIVLYVFYLERKGHDGGKRDLRAYLDRTSSVQFVTTDSTLRREKITTSRFCRVAEAPNQCLSSPSCFSTCASCGKD